jgi:RNA polymerase sigma factor (sigma-70 family)
MSYLREHPELLARVRAGDRAAQAVVFRVYAPQLDRILERGFTVPRTGQRIPAIKRRSARADIVQEAFVRVLDPKVLLAYDGVRDFLPLLVTIALNVFVSQHRRHGRELPVGSRDSWADGQIAEIELHDEVADPEQDARLAIMREYVASLPEQLRAFHAARHVEGLAQEDVAERLGITRWVARSFEQRMRKELRARLVKAGLGGDSDG